MEWNLWLVANDELDISIDLEVICIDFAGLIDVGRERRKSFELIFRQLLLHLLRVLNTTSSSLGCDVRVGEVAGVIEDEVILDDNKRGICGLCVWKKNKNKTKQKNIKESAWQKYAKNGINRKAFHRSWELHSCEFRGGRGVANQEWDQDDRDIVRNSTRIELVKELWDPKGLL